jgi:tripartite ATP-independent transporter DctM subunit
MMGYTYVQAIRYGYPANPRAAFKDVLATVIVAVPPLLIPVIVLGGVITGIFTPTEAAISAVIWALILTFIAYRDVRLTELPGLLTKSAVDFSVPLFAVAGAGIFGWLISFLGAADLVVEFILSVTQDPQGILLLLVGFLLLVGTVLNPISAVLIFLPIIQALGQKAGINPVHLGVLTTIALSVGLITPPYGICLLIASQIGEVKVTKAIVAILPIVGLVVLVAVLTLWVPDIITGLPKLFMPTLFLR